MRDIFEELATSEDTETDPVRRARELSRRELPRRFYTDVAVVPEDGGFAIHLDGRPVKTPARNALLLPGEQVAKAVAAEWGGQGSHIDPATMHLTRLANSAIDGVAAEREAVADDVARFAAGDLLYYRADGPERLIARQTGIWDPVLEWAEARFSIRFRLAEGIMPIEQDPAVVAAVRAALSAEPLALAALHSMTTLTGSVILALAAAERCLTVDEAWTAAHVDEDWNIELWGEDEEARARRAYRRAEFQAAAVALGIG